MVDLWLDLQSLVLIWLDQIHNESTVTLDANCFPLNFFHE